MLWIWENGRKLCTHYYINILITFYICFPTTTIQLITNGYTHTKVFLCVLIVFSNCLCNCYNQYYNCNTWYHMVQHWIHNIVFLLLNIIYFWTLVELLGSSFAKKFMLYWVLGNDFFQHGTIKFGWKILNVMSIWSNQMALGQHSCTRCVANI